ncbi:MAG: PaaI family thioesterase [Mycobacteriales bacterium]
MSGPATAGALQQEQLAAAERLVTQVRALMLAAATSTVPVADLDEAARLVERATQLAGASRQVEGLRLNLDRAAIARTAAGEPWQVFRHNPLGIPLTIEVDGDLATAALAPTALLEGPPQVLHGGFSAAMMDALISTLVQVQGLRAVTVRLEVEFLAAVPLDEPLHLTARLVEVAGRKVRATGSVQQRGVEVVRAEALLITVAGEPD